ncbi:hypothetical protein D3C73_1058900 [compost metagenome]
MSPLKILCKLGMHEWDLILKSQIPYREYIMLCTRCGKEYDKPLLCKLGVHKYKIVAVRGHNFQHVIRCTKCGEDK